MEEGKSYEKTDISKLKKKKMCNFAAGIQCSLSLIKMIDR